jgi:hypothetical protein
VRGALVKARSAATYPPARRIAERLVQNVNFERMQEDFHDLMLMRRAHTVRCTWVDFNVAFSTIFADSNAEAAIGLRERSMQKYAPGMPRRGCQGADQQRVPDAVGGFASATGLGRAWVALRRS